MTVILPTDGWGIYEGITPANPTSLTRLDTIAQGGFNLVMNSSLLAGHIGDILTYITRAANNGIKVIVGVHNQAIWKTNAIAATYPFLSADATAAGYAGTTDLGFTQYVVDQTTNLAGVWGYYVGDEVVAADHAAMLAHSGYVSARTSKPRLIIEGSSDSALDACYNGNSIFFDCCDVIGDDFYPIGDAAAYTNPTRTTAIVASGIQSYCNTHTLNSAMVLQAHSWINYGHKYGNSQIPWPNSEQMKQAQLDACSNMTARVILWYSYYDVISGTAPIYQWNALVNAVNNRNGYVFL